MSDEPTCQGCSGHRCMEHADELRAVKAMPVDVVATWPEHEFKITAPLWMLHVFAKMVREFNAQTPGVLYELGHRNYRSRGPNEMTYREFVKSLKDS